MGPRHTTKGEKLNKNSNSEEFFKAAKEGDVKKISSFLETSIDPNLQDEDGKTALHLAIEKGDHLEVVKLLIEKGANVNSKTLYKALESPKSFEIVKLLIKRGMNLDFDNKKNYTMDFVLQMAGMRGWLEVIKLLVEKGVNINYCAKKSALQWASCQGHLEIVKFLVEKGANVNLKHPEHGNIALHYASRSGHLEIVKLLVEKEASVNTQNKYGRTALHHASECTESLFEGHESNPEHKEIEDYLEIVKLLVEKGANINIQDEHGRTALHIASVNGRLEMVKLLVEKGADIKVKNNKGETPF